jgi:hypothetical protein
VLFSGLSVVGALVGVLVHAQCEEGRGASFCIRRRHGDGGIRSLYSSGARRCIVRRVVEKLMDWWLADVRV